MDDSMSNAQLHILNQGVHCNYLSSFIDPTAIMGKRNQFCPGIATLEDMDDLQIVLINVLTFGFAWLSEIPQQHHGGDNRHGLRAVYSYRESNLGLWRDERTL